MKYVVRKVFPNPYENAIQVFDYEGLSLAIPALLSCGVQDAPNTMMQSKSAVHVSANGKRLVTEDLVKMRNDYLSFQVERRIEEPPVVVRGKPVPHSGKARYNDDRYEFRSKMVSFGKERMIEFRSDRKDRSWKKNSKARKSWGKHMNPGDCGSSVSSISSLRKSRIVCSWRRGIPITARGFLGR